MSAIQEAEKPRSPPHRAQRTPPRLSPSPDATDSPDFKLSRKREREVSLEPVTTPSATNQDIDPLVRERKDSRTPLKKNRRRLDPTQEEEDGAASGSRSGSGSPPSVIMASPRQEMKLKVRQISQGVEDIHWKGFHAPVSTKDVDIEDASGAPDGDVVPDTSATGEVKEEVSTIVPEEDDMPSKSPDDSVLSSSIQEVKADVAMIPDFEAPSGLLAPPEINEKGLKRKFLERGTSQGPPENGDAAKHPTEPLKRPRDEADKDDNPREPKRPSPPPSPPRLAPTSPKVSSPKVSKASGFMAYASTSSPFASVKGQNLFSSKAPSPPSFSSSPAPSTPLAELSSTFGTPSTSTSTATKRSGFEAFTSTTSPFGAFARAKSPVLGSTSKLARAKSPPRRVNPSLTSNPFASYAGPSQGFSLPAQKRVRAGSPDESTRSSVERLTPAPSASVPSGSGNASENEAEEEQEEEQHATFGDRLRATKDDDDEARSDDEKPQLTEQDVMTGEEEEETLHQVRGKLFSLHENQWKERGTGLLKLNVKVDDGTGARLVMRKDAVYALLLNITLFPGMRCSLAQDPRYLRFSAIENGVATTYNLKLPNAKIAADLLEDINANIPT